MSRRKVFVAGEGKHDIGGRANQRPFQDEEPGAVQTLLAKIAPDRCEFIGGTAWKNIRKFQVGRHAQSEVRNVLGAALQAAESGADLLALMRDRDGDADRERAIWTGIKLVQEVDVIGGVAVEALEAWVLAVNGDRRSESDARPKDRLKREYGIQTREGIVAALAQGSLDCLPVDAISLRRWLERAQSVLGDGR